MKTNIKNKDDELRSEYDFDYTKAVRGKYYRRLLDEGANIIVIDPDLAKAFGDSEAVNKALRSLLDFTNSTQRLTKHPHIRSKKVHR